MRAFLALLIVLGTTGCTTEQWSHIAAGVGADGIMGSTPSQSDARSNATPMNENCEEVASNRASDLANEDFDSDVRKAVHDKVYAECLAWAARTTITEEK